ncbi:MAG TPA: SRPBCC domain-containing protein [bacterium]
MSLSPILCAVEVPLAPVQAFALFLRLGDWWPLATNSLGLRNAVGCTLEPKAGGRIYERTAEGLESAWGTLSECNEPERLRFTWHPGRHASTAQEVEVRFTRAGTGTRVELEQRGWEKAGDRAAKLHKIYTDGWPNVLAQYRAKASGTAGSASKTDMFHG